MKKLFLAAALVLLSLSTAKAQATAHEVDLSWTASADSTATNPGTVTVQRASGACPASGLGTLTFTQLTSTAPAGGPFKDTTVTSGTWCYFVTATINGLTSGPSNTAGSSVPTAPATSLTTVVIK